MNSLKNHQTEVIIHQYILEFGWKNKAEMKNATFPRNMVKISTKCSQKCDFFLDHFLEICERKDKNFVLDDEFPLKITNVSPKIPISRN